MKNSSLFNDYFIKFFTLSNTECNYNVNIKISHTNI